MFKFNLKYDEIMEGILKGTSKEEKEDRVKAKILKIIEKSKTTGNLNLCYLKLTTLKGFGLENLKLKDFDCADNKLTSLEGAPESVGGRFSCRNNNLTSLEGAPESVGRYFDCGHNKLTSLEGAPESVGGSFDCDHNLLTSLKGAPKIVENFDCSNNALTSLKGAPKSVGGSFDCCNNSKKFTEEEVRAVCDVKDDVKV